MYALVNGKLKSRPRMTSFGTVSGEELEAIFEEHGLEKESSASDPDTGEPLYLPEGTKLEEVDGKLVITLGSDVTMKEGACIYGFKITEVDGPEED